MKIEEQNFKKNGYFLFRQIINMELSLVFMNYLGLKKLCFETGNKNLGYIGHWGDTLIQDAYSLYGDTMFDTLLVTLQPTIEKITNEKLYPTYSYARWYTKENFMKKHKDRKECTVSVTLNLGGDIWPFYIKDLNKKNKCLEMSAGDAVIYQGDKCEHWRKKFNGKICAQLFLHYSKDEKDKFDGRKNLGIPSDINRIININKANSKN